MIPLLSSLLSPAIAQTEPAATFAEDEEEVSEVVIVWPDKFARWKDTRWMIAAEVVVPSGMVFSQTNNFSFRTYAWQVKAVLSCDQDYKLGAKRIEVLCEIEDIGLRSTSYNRYKTVEDRELVQGVLDELDQKLSHAKVQLQVNDRGSVTDIDIDGLPRRNSRDAGINETLRQIVARMMYPFHMKLPKSGIKEGRWPEFDSELMSMPSVNGITGSSTITHWMNFYKGYLLVQDIGAGLVQVEGPASESDAGGVVNWRLGMDGVSLYNIDNGIMEERVWSMVGKPTASNLSRMKYWYSGHIQLLGPNDTVEVGSSEQISYPAIEIEGLPVWLPVDPEMAKGLEDFRPEAQVQMKDKEKKKLEEKAKQEE